VPLAADAARPTWPEAFPDRGEARLGHVRAVGEARDLGMAAVALRARAYHQIA
jgi:hypothetical protein